jgi:hypothetical protein
MNNNTPQPRFGYLTDGILTYDGIHPTTVGNSLLADQIAEGIYKALVPEPSVLGMLVIACAALGSWRRRVG